MAVFSHNSSIVFENHKTRELERADILFHNRNGISNYVKHWKWSTNFMMNSFVKI